MARYLSRVAYRTYKPIAAACLVLIVAAVAGAQTGAF